MNFKPYRNASIEARHIKSAFSYFWRFFSGKHLSRRNCRLFPQSLEKLLKPNERKKIQLKRKKKSENAAHIFCAQFRAFFLHFHYRFAIPPIPLKEKGWSTTPRWLFIKTKENEKKWFFFIFYFRWKMEKGKGWSGILNVGGKNKNFGVWESVQVLCHIKSYYLECSWNFLIM